MPVELRLIFLCLHSPSESVYEEIKSLTAQMPDWDRFLYWCTRHRVVSQLYGMLDADVRALLPDKILKALQGFALKNTGYAMNLSAGLTRIVRHLEEEGVRVVSLKGPTLALWAYGDVNMRSAGDLDMLVAPDDIDRVDEILRKAGYRNTTPGDRFRDHLHRLLAKSDYVLPNSPPIHLELHSRLMIHPALMPAAFDELYDRAVDIRIADVSIKTLAPQDLLMFLMAHGSEHAWFCAGWLCDIAQVMRHHPEIDWPAIVRRMDELGLRRILNQTMYLVSTLLGVAVPDSARADDEPDRLTIRLGETAVDAMCDEQYFNLEWHTLSPGKVLKATWYRLNFHRGLRYKADVLFKMLVRPEDWDDIPLPRSLFLLYYPLNPVLFIKRRLSGHSES